MISKIIQRRFFNQQALTPVKSSFFWKSNEDDPLKHNQDHLGLFYQIPKENKLIMIRKPALAIKNYLQCIDHRKPTTRFLIYGEFGAGKTMTLDHIRHYVQSLGDYFIINIPNARIWAAMPSDQSESVSRKGRIDLPIDSAFFLTQFKILNSDLMAKHEIICDRDYNWSSREITKKGEPIANVVEHGISRVNHASDCLAVLLRVLKNYANEGNIKMCVLVDKVNYFYSEEPLLKHSDRKVAYPSDITPTRAFRKLFKNDWNGGVVIAIVDKKQIDKTAEVLPRKLLTIEGWNEFEPCLPIEVPRYTRKEFETCMDYYQDTRWLQRPESMTEEGRDEIRFVSGMNPYEVQRICRYL